MTKLLEQKVRYIRPRLMKDFPWSKDDADACIGNLAHESGGFALMQEVKPIVPGSRGGFGWAQWTGPRRRAFEAYCRRNGLDPYSDKANYAFLFVELKGSERHTIRKVSAAQGLKGKVIAFEKAFERAGIKHYNSRLKWAEKVSAITSRVLDKDPPPIPADRPTISDRFARMFSTLFSGRS